MDGSIEKQSQTQYLHLSNEMSDVLDGKFPVLYEQSMLSLRLRSATILSKVSPQDLHSHIDDTRSLFDAHPQAVDSNLYTVKTLAAVQSKSDYQLQWHEYLAINSYLWLEELLLFVPIFDDVFEGYCPIHNPYPAAAHSQECLIGATESIVLAEFIKTHKIDFNSEPRVQLQAKLHISRNNRKAAQKRNEPINKIKESFIAHRKTLPKDISTINIARRFLKTLPEADQKLFSTENGAKTLQRAYGAYCKERKKLES